MTDQSAPTSFAVRALRIAVAAPLIGMLSIIFCISFSAIIYNGALGPFLSQGIGLTMIGAVLMASIGAFLFSYRGTITQPQDVTAILLSFAAANIAGSSLIDAPQTAFATVAMLILISTFMTGIAAYAFGRFGLGFVARFLPYPVLAGFLAATGYLLTVGAIGMITRTSVDIWGLPAIFQADALMLWAPWLLVAVAITIITRLAPRPMTLPLLLAAAGIGFYILLALFGISLADARAAGLLIGPFQDASFLTGLSPALVFDVDWRLITAQVPTIIAVIAMTIIGTIMSASALGVSIGRDININTDLKAVGLSNLAASAGGGLVGYHLMAETVIARKLGLTGYAAGLSAAVFVTLALIFGAGALSALPIGIFAAVVGYLGIDLLYTWLWVQRRNLPAQDYALVLIILAVAAAIGFLQALTVGLLAAAMLFIYSYAQIDTVRLRSTIATRRSSVERGRAADTRLQEDGHAVQVTELSGYLFFGTANRLSDTIAEELRTQPGITRLILDFTRVPELDASAAFALERIAKTCADNGVTLWCSGAAADRQTRFPTRRLSAEGATIFPTLDEALQAAEDLLLTARPAPEDDQGFLAHIRARHPDLALESVFKTRHLAAGEVLVAQGAQSEEMFILLSGTLQAEVTGVDGKPAVVSRFLPGALLGEIAYYASVPRTAAIRASEASEVMRLDAKALDGDTAAAALAQDVHHEAARTLARRLIRTTQMLRAGGF